MPVRPDPLPCRGTDKPVEHLLLPHVPAGIRRTIHGVRKDCDTPLTYRRIDGPNISITLNSLDDPDQAPPPSVALVTKRRPGWLDRLGSLPRDD